MSRILKKLQKHLRLYAWMCGDEEPNSTSWAATECKMDQITILDTMLPKLCIHGFVFHIVHSNEMRVVVGTRLADQIQAALEDESNPLRQKTPDECM